MRVGYCVNISRRGRYRRHGEDVALGEIIARRGRRRRRRRSDEDASCDEISRRRAREIARRRGYRACGEVGWGARRRRGRDIRGRRHEYRLLQGDGWRGKNTPRFGSTSRLQKFNPRRAGCSRAPTRESNARRAPYNARREGSSRAIVTFDVPRHQPSRGGGVRFESVASPPSFVSS